MAQERKVAGFVVIPQAGPQIPTHGSETRTTPPPALPRTDTVMIGGRRPGRRAAVGLLCAGAAALFCSACSCEREGIDASMSARLEDDGATPRELRLEGRVVRSNIASEFDAVRTAVRGGSAGGRLVFTLTTTGTAAPADLALTLPTPLRQGEVLPVVGVFQGGGWGIFRSGASDGAEVSWRRDGAYATSADGVVRVVDSDPLLLDVDLTLRTGDGGDTTLMGTIRFSTFSDPVSCT